MCVCRLVYTSYVEAGVEKGCTQDGNPTYVVSATLEADWELVAGLRLTAGRLCFTDLTSTLLCPRR